jgi:predicted glycoside hydrolase/deacetylase ChbG (UPF0249 family)
VTAVAGLRPLVLVADDHGESAHTNAGIAAALAAGAVRETSLMVVGEAAEAGARLAKDAHAGLGLHLSFTHGRALTGPLRGLTRGDGRFLGLASVLLACRLGVPDRVEVRREVEAQWERLLALGVEPTHLNGHHHAHAFPVVRDAVAGLAKERGIPYVRVPLERAQTGGALSARRWVVARQARGLVRALAAVHLAPPPLTFVGLALESRRDFPARFGRTLERVEGAGAGVECMVHPRTGSRTGAAEAEHLARADLRTSLEARGWRPATFSEALGAQAGGGSGP